jgi:hypothetical protein
MLSGGVLISERNTSLSGRGDESQPPWFFTDHPGFMALTGNILGKQDIPLTKPPFIAAAHLNFSLPSRGITYFRQTTLCKTYR